MFKRILIANRGEIAVRIIRACQEMDIRTVAVYSEADAQAMHVRLADVAVPIGPPPPGESYLHIERIVEAARSTGAEAIHPGYGFLSENAAFVRAVRDAGLVFIGPTANAVQAMGNKIGARSLVKAAGVPVLPGYHGAADAGFGEMAGTIGYPVLIKAAAGGGGRGMRIVRRPTELADAIDSAEREAARAFGDGSIFLEKYVEHAHHVEFQVFGDAHGNVVQLFERECSTQRRHQKIVEETPSPLLDGELRERMGWDAVAAARAVNYQNAGTIEFIVDRKTRDFYFLEMNTRLQVEHPVTEWLTGLDLVNLQIRVAAGERLPFAQADVTARGHAIECRVYAEDPANGFLPATGTVLKASFPSAPGVRVDAGLESGDEVSIHYDPMIAKISVLGQHRAEAIHKLNWALAHTTILGVTTNLRFLRDVLAHPAFARGEVTTDFVEREFADWQPPSAPADLAMIASALNDVSGAGGNAPNTATPLHEAQPDPWQTDDNFRLGGT